ncbi:MAG: T9SS type A sorting domain-containing protein [Krumholzibacteria bacterium]|nr:T9SS type A sorting domain-containing protein [Candidatus Krumholzibacteria bacterium]
MRRAGTMGGWALQAAVAVLCLAVWTAPAVGSCFDLDTSFKLQNIDRWGDGLVVRDIAAGASGDPVWVLFEQGTLVGLAADREAGFRLLAILRVDPGATCVAVDGQAVAVGGPGAQLDVFAWEDPRLPAHAGRLVLPGPIADLDGGYGIVAACGEAGLVRVILAGGVPEVAGSTAEAAPALAVAVVPVTGKVYAGTGGRELVRFRADTAGGFLRDARLSVPGVPRSIAWALKPDAWGSLRTELALPLDDGRLRLLRDLNRSIDDLGFAPVPAACRGAAVLQDAVVALGDDGTLAILSPPLDSTLAMAVMDRLDAEPGRCLAVHDDALLLGTFRRGLLLAVLPEGASSPAPEGSFAAGGNAAAVAGDVLALAGDRLTIVDLAGEVPAIRGTADLPEPSEGIALGDGLACVADYNSGLVVYAVPDAGDPVAVGQLLFGSPAWKVVLVGTTALVGAGTSLEAVDLSDPAAPQLVATRSMAAVAQDMVLVGNTLWVAHFGLERYDVSDPAAPVNLGTTTVGGRPYRLAAGGGVLVAMVNVGLTVIDVANPASPVALSYYRMPTDMYARAVGMSGRAVWAAAGNGSLLHLRLDDGVLHGPVVVTDVGPMILRLVPRADQLLAVRWADTFMLAVDCAALRPPGLPLQLVQTPAAAFLLWPTDAAGGAEVCVFRDGGADPAAETPLACSGAGFYADVTTDLHCYRVAYRDAWGVWSPPSNEVCRKSTPSAVPTEPATGLTAAPNPFNPGTELRFTLSAPGRVTLAVHDLTGRRIAVLVDGRLNEGGHAVAWQGRDTAGRTVASGVYVARLVTAEGTTTRRLTLLR